MEYNASQKAFMEDFASLEDEFDKYTYLTHLAGLLGVPDDSLKAERYLIKGCQSDAWMRVSLRDGGVFVEAYSDTLIVRGLLYILRESVNGTDPRAFSRSACEDLYRETGLTSMLTESRRSGLRSILDTAEKCIAQL